VEIVRGVVVRLNRKPMWIGPKVDVGCAATFHYLSVHYLLSVPTRRFVSELIILSLNN
jgi:hypothetical protein